MARRKRKYTFTPKARAAALQNLQAAWLATHRPGYRPSPRRLAACHASLTRAAQSNRALDSPAYGTCFSHGVRAADLHRSARLCGENREEFERHVDGFRRALPPTTERLEHGVRGLAEITWRHARLWGGRAYSERLQFYYWLGQAASPDFHLPPLDASRGPNEPNEPHGPDWLLRLQWLEAKVTAIFDHRPLNLDDQAEALRYQAARIGHACVEELTGQPDPEFRVGYRIQRRIPGLLDRPGESLGNPRRSLRVVERALARVGAEVPAIGAWGGWARKLASGAWDLRRVHLQRDESKVAQFGLARRLAASNASLPDPLRPEDFAAHLRIVQLALGWAENEIPNSKIETRSSGLQAADGQDGEAQGGRDRRPGSGPESPAPDGAEFPTRVREFADSTWKRLGIFAAAAQRERQQARETAERAARGERFTPPPSPLPGKVVPGEFVSGRDDPDEWLEAWAVYGKEPLAEEHYKVERLLGAVLAADHQDVLEAAESASQAVAAAFGKLREWEVGRQGQQN